MNLDASDLGVARMRYGGRYGSRQFEPTTADDPTFDGDDESEGELLGREEFDSVGGGTAFNDIGGDATQRDEQFKVSLDAMILSLKARRAELEREHPLAKSGFETAVRAAMGRNAQATATSLFDQQTFDSRLEQIVTQSKLAHTYESTQKDKAYDDEQLSLKRDIAERKLQDAIRRRKQFANLLDNRTVTTTLFYFSRHAPLLAQLAREKEITQNAYLYHTQGYYDEISQLSTRGEWDAGWGIISNLAGDDLNTIKALFFTYLLAPLVHPTKSLGDSAPDLFPALTIPTGSSASNSKGKGKAKSTAPAAALRHSSYGEDPQAKSFLGDEWKEVEALLVDPGTLSRSSNAPRMSPQVQPSDFERPLFADPPSEFDTLFGMPADNDQKIVKAPNAPDLNDAEKKVSALGAKISELQQSLGTEEEARPYEQTALAFRYRWASVVFLLLPAYMGSILLSELAIEGDKKGFNTIVTKTAKRIQDALQKNSNSSTAADVTTTFQERIDSILDETMTNELLESDYLEKLEKTILQGLHVPDNLDGWREAQFNAYIRANIDKATGFYRNWRQIVDNLWTLDLNVGRNAMVSRITLVMVGVELYRGFYQQKLANFAKQITGLKNLYRKLNDKIQFYEDQLTATERRHNGVANSARDAIAQLIKQVSSPTSVSAGPELDHAMNVAFGNVQQAFPQYQNLPSPLALALASERGVQSAFAEGVAAIMVRARARTGQMGYFTNERYAILSNDVARSLSGLRNFVPAGARSDMAGGWRFKRRSGRF